MKKGFAPASAAEAAMQSMMALNKAAQETLCQPRFRDAVHAVRSLHIWEEKMAGVGGGGGREETLGLGKGKGGSLLPLLPELDECAKCVNTTGL